MKWKLARARTTKINLPPPRHTTDLNITAGIRTAGHAQLDVAGSIPVPSPSLQWLGKFARCLVTPSTLLNSGPTFSGIYRINTVIPAELPGHAAQLFTASGLAGPAATIPIHR
jgi:hypothetical protein